MIAKCFGPTIIMLLVLLFADALPVDEHVEENTLAALLAIGSKQGASSQTRAEWPHIHHRHRPHAHHRHSPHVHHRHSPHVHVPHVHTAAMIKDAKDAAAKATKDAKDLADAKDAKDLFDKKAKDAKDLFDKKAKDAKDLAAKLLADAAKKKKDAKDLFDKKAKEAKDLAAKIAADAAQSSVSELEALGNRAIELAKSGIPGPLTDLAKSMLRKLLGSVAWTQADYRDYMTRFASDFNIGLLNTVDEYSDFNTKAHADVKNVARLAYRNLPLQDRCQVSLKDHPRWLEYNPMPVSSIPVFKTFPFSEQNKDSWLIEPCNAVSNGAFLKLFSRDDVIDDIKLQYAAFGMCWGSWYFHGDGAFHEGTAKLDTWSIDVMFYYVYKEAVDKLIIDATLRKQWADPTGGLKNVSDHRAEVDNWVQVMKMDDDERNVVLKVPKDCTIPEICKDGNTTDIKKAEKLMEKMPEMMDTISALVILLMRAVFHSGVPGADEIYTYVTDLIINSLITEDERRVKVRALRGELDKTKVKGFNDPTQGGVKLLEIFAEFLEAMFWQEQGKMAKGAKVLKSHVPPDAGCQWMPHSVWHRKAQRVIGGFLDALPLIETSTSQNPSTFSTCSNIVRGTSRLVLAMAKVANIARGNAMECKDPCEKCNDPCDDARVLQCRSANWWPDGEGRFKRVKHCKKITDVVGTGALLQDVRRKFGKGWWPPGQATWSKGGGGPTCTKSPTAAPTANATMLPTFSPNSTTSPMSKPANSTTSPKATLTGSPTAMPMLKVTDMPAVNVTHMPTLKVTNAPTLNPTSMPSMPPAFSPSNATSSTSAPKPGAQADIESAAPTSAPAQALRIALTTLPTSQLPTQTPKFESTSAPSVPPSAAATVAPLARHRRVVLKVKAITQASFARQKEQLRVKIAQLLGVNILRVDIALKTATAETTGRRLLVTPFDLIEASEDVQPAAAVEIDVTIQDSVSTDGSAVAKENVSPDQAVSILESTSAAALSTELGLSVQAIEVVPTTAPVQAPSSLPEDKTLEQSSPSESSTNGTSNTAVVVAGCVVAVLVVAGVVFVAITISKKRHEQRRRAHATAIAEQANGSDQMALA